MALLRLCATMAEDAEFLRPAEWPRGTVPLAVIMISLNEGHNLQAVCDNLRGWAGEVFLVDSYSKDFTIDIALKNGVHVVQRQFTNFGDQWNFALARLPIQSPWTMKLDPDERVTEQLKASIAEIVAAGDADGIEVTRELWFMGRRLGLSQKCLRVWRTGACRFTDVSVNEHPVVRGTVFAATGALAHHDSPSLEHWIEKQNRYTTAEAVMAHTGATMADEPKLLGTALQRRMWMKRYFRSLPFRFQLFFLFNYIWRGAWKAGWPGYAWARLRSDVMRLIEYKRREFEILGRVPPKLQSGAGQPDDRVRQY
jgi:hypothetical protein